MLAHMICEWSSIVSFALDPETIVYVLLFQVTKQMHNSHFAPLIRKSASLICICEPTNLNMTIMKETTTRRTIQLANDQRLPNKRT